MSVRFLIRAVLVFVAAVPAAAEDVVVNQNDVKGTRDCKGGNADIVGNEARLALEDCRRVTVTGNENTIDAGSPETLTVLGNENRVTWRPTPDGRRAKVVNLGNDNTVTEAKAVAAAPVAAAPAGSAAPATRAQPAAASKPAESATVGRGARQEAGAARSGGLVGAVLPGAGDLTVSGDGQHRTYDCHGKAAFLAGDDNDLVMQNCAHVNASGDDNKIRVEGAGSISVSGDRNRIQWTPGPSGAPRISNQGADNSIAQAR